MAWNDIVEEIFFHNLILHNFFSWKNSNFEKKKCDALCWPLMKKTFFLLEVNSKMFTDMKNTILFSIHFFNSLWLFQTSSEVTANVNIQIFSKTATFMLKVNNLNLKRSTSGDNLPCQQMVNRYLYVDLNS